MEETLKRGPKPKSPEEKKVAVVFWVQQKFFNLAKKDANDLERKYNTKKS